MQATVGGILQAFRDEGCIGDAARNCVRKTTEEHTALVAVASANHFTTAGQVRDAVGLDVNTELVRQRLLEASLKNRSDAKKPLLQMRSGTEEEYDEKERLLTEVNNLAQNSGYKLKNTAVRKVAATQKQKQQREMTRRPATEKRTAAAIRDLSTSDFTASETDGMSVDEYLESYYEENLWSTNVYDVAQKTSACVRGGYEVLATVPQLPASTSVSLSQQRAASDTAVVQDLSPSPTPSILPGSNPRPVPSTTPDPTLDPSLDPTLDPTSASHASPILGPTPGTSSGPTPGSSSGPTGGLLPSVASGYMHTPPDTCLGNRMFQFTTVRTFEVASSSHQLAVQYG
ncbi:hypothetical protein MTO96_021334 [Rhipicephalus appendiculatus]